MTTIRVDAAEVAELGVALAETGADLLLLGDPSVERWALGPGAAAVVSVMKTGSGRQKRDRQRMPATRQTLPSLWLASG